MSKHPDAFTIDRQVSPDEALADPKLFAQASQLHVPKKARGGFRRLLMVGASLAAIAGGSYYGWNYWTVGRFNVSTDDATSRPTASPSPPRSQVTSARCSSATTKP